MGGAIGTDSTPVDTTSQSTRKRSGRHPDPNPDLSGNLCSNPGSHLVEFRRLGGGLSSLSSY